MRTLRSSSLPSRVRGEPEQLVLDLVERALGPGDLEQRRGVALDAILRCHARDPDLLDVVLDELGLRRRVEVALDDDLGGTDRESSNLGTKVGDGLRLRRLDVRGGALTHGGELGLQRGLALALEGIGLLPRLFDDASGLVLRVGELRPVLLERGLGLRLRRVSLFDALADALGPGVHALLDAGIRELPQQEEQDDKRDDAPDQLVGRRQGSATVPLGSRRRSRRPRGSRCTPPPRGRLAHAGRRPRPHR